MAIKQCGWLRAQEGSTQCTSCACTVVQDGHKAETSSREDKKANTMAKGEHILARAVARLLGTTFRVIGCTQYAGL